MLSTTLAKPSQPHGGAVRLPVSHKEDPPLLNLGCRKGRVKARRVWVGPGPMAGLGREGRGGERV